MKTIRYIAAFLLLLTGILHLIPIFSTPSDPNAVPMLAFGIAYFTVGVLLYQNIKFSAIIGIILPFIGLCIGFFKVGVMNWTSLLTFLFVIDAVVIICCFIILLKQAKKT